ncbi:unnamed protein product [Zymoseptoria tritici ST99CH_1A5]|nr:unnamed protein product [Zymoseptoria tritici ST99CH_1A5]
MNQNGASPPDRYNRPHVRLNSNTDDILDMSHNTNPTSHPSTTSNPHPLPPAPSSRQTSRSFAQPSALRTALSRSAVYSSQGPTESAERLLPPSTNGRGRFRDESASPSASRTPSRSPMRNAAFPAMSDSRRSSWSIESGDSRLQSPFASPFDDSRAPSRAGSDEDVNTQTVSEKYNILPSAGLLLFPEDVEKDDYMHNPDPNDKDGRLSCSEMWSKRGMVNLGGLLFITIGILVLFIGYPILTFVQKAIKDAHPEGYNCEADPMCLNEKFPLFKNIRTGLVDPDTPDGVKSRTGDNGKRQTLVFSDEFNDAGRTFYDGDDPFFQAMDFCQDLEWYDPDAVVTSDGVLNLKFDAFANHDLNYRSGMLQSWNKLCFKGGYLEASISLPGRGDTIGFWPGFWSMGNLGRPGYAATTDGMWPYSYHDKCDPGITPNQSDPDGLSYLPGMRLPACTCSNADHPSPGNSRSAPEIDAIEASVEYLTPPLQNAIGSASQSFQVAPFDVFWQPNADWMEIYDHSITKANAYQGGVYQEAVSALVALNNDWYDGKAYQTYAFEYEPGGDGYITWYVGDDRTWKVTGNALGPNGNIGQRVISQEPMSIIANFGMSDSFSALNLTGLMPLLPATMRIDYIRIYQDEDGELTCDPAGYPTTQYIAEHPVPYANQNMTHWEQAGFDFPQNSFMHNCKADTKMNKREEERRMPVVKRSRQAPTRHWWE